MAKIDREILITFGETYYGMLSHARYAKVRSLEGHPEAAYTYAKITATYARHVLAMLDRMEQYQYPPILRGDLARKTGPACQQCGKPVEYERSCYAHPVCYACLPPPEPLPTVRT